MDEIFMERAEERERMARDDAIAAAARAVAPETHPDFDGSSCVKCGEDIPLARLALGKVRCVYCQTLKEKHHAYTGT